MDQGSKSKKISHISVGSQRHPWGSFLSWGKPPQNSAREHTASCAGDRSLVAGGSDRGLSNGQKCGAFRRRAPKTERGFFLKELKLSAFLPSQLLIEA